MRVVFLTLAATAILYGQGNFGGLGGFGSVGRARDPVSGAGRNLQFTPFLSLMGSYSDYSGGSHGSSGSGVSRGLRALAGVHGGRAWAHTLLSAGYTGQAHYLRMSGRPERVRQSHVAQIAAVHNFSPRLGGNFSQLGGTSIGGYGLGAGFGGFGSMGMLSGLGSTQFNQSGAGVAFGNPASNGVVDSAILDARTNFSLSSGALSYRLTNRWILSAGGNAAFARRSGNLINLNAQTAGGQAAYYLTEHSSVSFHYSNTWLSYPKRFGGILSQTTGIGYGRQFSPSSRIELFIGSFDIRSDFIGRVAIDPEIAQILGVAVGYETRRVRLRSLAGGLSFHRSWGHNHVRVSYNRGMIPGSDLLMAARRDMAAVSLGRTLSPRFNANATLMGNRSKGSVGVLHRIDQYQATGGFAIRLGASLSFNVNAGYRIIEAPTRGTLRGMTAFAGLSWTPRDWAVSF